ncbi:MAG: asparagine--tRNA ligase [Candidatus Diapherotrites archaeon]
MDLAKIEKAFSQKKGEFYTRGWIKRKRDMKGKLFFLLRDETGEVQCVADLETLDKKISGDCLKATIESSIYLRGELHADERAPGGVELRISSIEIVGLAEDFPIQKDFSTEYLLDVRHLWVRSAKMRDAFKVRATVFDAFREFMAEQDCTEVQGPMFVGGMVEGSMTLFKVPYFDKTVFLTQSSQFYLEVMMYSLGNVYTIAPSFRAEKSKTTRHLTEFWHAEVELPWVGLKEIVDFEEAMVKHIVKTTVEKREKELKALGRNIEELAPTIEKKFQRMRYDEVLEIAKKKFPHLKSGADFGEKEEREITRKMDTPLIVTHYPASIKPFYHRPDPENPAYVLCNDMLAPEGYGEIIGSGERTWKEEELTSRMKEQGLDLKPYKWYIDLRKYGSVPHAGFGLGLDRLTSWIAKTGHIRDVIPFPRTMNRYYP